MKNFSSGKKIKSEEKKNHIKKTLKDNQSLLRDYLATISIATQDLLRNQAFISAASTVANQYNANDSLSDYYAPLYLIQNIYNATSGRNLVNDMHTSLISNGATATQISLFNQYGLSFTLSNITFSPQLFLYYRSSNLYPGLAEPTIPSLAISSFNFTDNIPARVFVPVPGTIGVFQATTIPYNSLLSSPYWLVSYEYKDSDGDVFFLKNNDGAGKCALGNKLPRSLSCVVTGNNCSCEKSSKLVDLEESFL